MRNTLRITSCALLPAAGDAVQEPVDVVLVGERIAAIEPAGRSAADGGPELDGRGLLVMAGLVNAHTHSPENPLRGVGEGLALEPWLVMMFGLAGPYTPEDHYICALAGALEMLTGGTTAVVDHLWMTPPSLEAVEATVRAYQDAGIRAAVAPLVDDADWTGPLARVHGLEDDGDWFPRPRAPQDVDSLIALTAEAIDRWHLASRGRLRILAGPSGVQWCSDELLGGLADLVRGRGTGLHLHLLETRLQKAACELRFSGSTVNALDELGVLGPDTSLPHSVWLDEPELALLAERRAIAVHNPAANLRLGSGRAPVREMLDAGLRVGLGTDGAASSDNQQMFDQLKLAALIHNDGERWVGGSDALRMATAGGAAAIGLEDELGVLAPGRLADLILVDRHGEGLAGASVLDPSLALSETGRAVRHVIVGGEIVVRDGACTRVEAAEVREGLAEQARRRRQLGPPGVGTTSAIERLNQLREAVGPCATFPSRGGTP